MMKEFFRKITALLIISCIIFFSMIQAYAENSIFYNTGMTRIPVRGSEEDNSDDNSWMRIVPGIYSISGAKQMRVTDADEEVLMFKGTLSGNETVTVELPQGGNLEYTGKIYLTEVKDDVSGDSEIENGASSINPFRYSPVKVMSFMKLGTCGCVEVNHGRVRVYSKNGELTYETYVLYEADTTGYIFYENIAPVDLTEKEDPGKTLRLNEGQRYVIGTDINEGEYISKGSGTVRVYDPDGYIKTVIKLKQADIPGSDGVESYRFRFGFNDQVITEGNIEITESK